jgi:hypothetical protein
MAVFAYLLLVAERAVRGSLELGTSRDLDFLITKRSQRHY